MAASVVEVAQQPWETLTTFHATTTFSEKVWRIVNNALFSAAAYSVYALTSGNVKNIPRIAYYIAIALAARKIASAIIGYCVYFAIYKPQAQLQAQEEVETQDLVRLGYSVQRISLNKSGVDYKAMIISHPNTVSNGKWSIHALGNNMAMEDVISMIARDNFPRGCNTLLINGPAVGKSFLEKLWVFPTRYQFGAGFEAGLQCLEKIMQATHIAMQGLSLGNGMMSEGILQHDFKIGKVAYLLISDRTFSRLSDIARVFATIIATFLCYLTGAELDGVAAAKEWTALGLPQIIIQHGIGPGTDYIIPDDVGLAKEFPADNHKDKRLLLSPDIRHNGALPGPIKTELNGHLDNFFRSKQQFRF